MSGKQPGVLAQMVVLLAILLVGYTIHGVVDRWQQNNMAMTCTFTHQPNAVYVTSYGEANDDGPMITVYRTTENRTFMFKRSGLDSCEGRRQ